MNLKCDDCGQFIKLEHVHRVLITPDSEFTKEEYETLCLRCFKKQFEMEIWMMLNTFTINALKGAGDRHGN